MAFDLSPEQRAVVESWGRGMAVMAGAGSGKTSTLVVKCQELLKLNPEARFAAVSFTERSAGDLQEKLAKSLQAGLGKNWVMTIHGLCGSILREFPRAAELDGEETILSESEARLFWEQATESLWTGDLPDSILAALERLLDRESRFGLNGLLRRVRELSSFGVLNRLATGDDASKDLGQIGEYVLQRYERLKRRRGALDFQDLELKADLALNDPEVARSYQKRFDLVLIDEFQDTNPLQASILWRFAKPDQSNLCVVGDPKQSIYRFRDADVTVFEESCQRLPEKHSLTWNFRSTPGIIDFTNRACEPAFEASQLEYPPLVARLNSNPDFDPVVRLEIKSPQDLARWVLAEQERGVPLDQMALLLRKIRGNEKWLKALSAVGIPIAVGSGGLFWEDPRVRELVAFLRWWIQPSNRLSGAVFLRAPWMNIADVTLDQWVKQDPTWVKPFFESDHFLAPVLRELRAAVIRPGELLEVLTRHPQIEEDLAAPLFALWHRVEELSSRGLDFHAVVGELSAAVDEGRREREVPPPKNLGQLSVLTLHGSKGLEFPHVILLDFAGPSRASPAPLLFWDRNKGIFFGIRDEDGERDRNHPDEKPWREIEKQKNLAESKRLFYVALTRAKTRLVLVCPEIEIKESEVSLYDRDDWRGWIDAASEGVSSVKDFPALSKVTIEDLQPLPARKISQRRTPLKRARHSVTEWSLLSRCPRAYEWRYIRSSLEEKKMTWSGTEAPELTQRELGTRVHACLETQDWDALKILQDEAGEDRLSARMIQQWAESSPLMKTDGEVFTELSFEIPIDGEVLVGSMDRVVKGAGTLDLVDFKITSKSKNTEALLDAYQTQMELYAWALLRLDPSLEGGELRPALVNISRSGVEVHPVSLAAGGLDVSSLVRQAKQIIEGEAGKPCPGSLCAVCDFRSQCPEALRGFE